MTGTPRTRAQAGQASGEIDHALSRLNGPHHCPSCGHSWTGTSDASPLPDDLPVRTPEMREVRADELAATGERFARTVAAAVGPDAYGIWLSPCALVDAAGSRIFLSAPVTTVGYVAERFARILSQVASELARREITVVVLTLDVPARTLGELHPPVTEIQETMPL